MMAAVKDEIVNRRSGREFDEIKSRSEKASTSKTVELRWNGHVDENVQELCQILASNPRLQTLVISGVTAFGTDTGGKHIADLLTGNPRLKTLNLKWLRPTLGCIDALGKALELPGATLESLSLSDEDTHMNANRTQRLTRMLSTNTSIKHFSLCQTSRQGADPAEVPWFPEEGNGSSNEQTELNEWMELERRGHVESEAQQGCVSLAHMLRQNRSMTSLSLSIFLGEAGPQPILKALEQNTTLEELHIHNILCWGQTGLTTLFKALTPSPPDRPKLRLKVLHLDQKGDRGPTGSMIVSTNDLPQPEVLAEMLLHNQTLQTLLICHGYTEEDWESVIVPAIAYNSTLNLVQRFPDPCSYTHPRPTWARLLKFNCVRCCFKVVTTIVGERWSPPVDYKFLSGCSNCFGLGAVYSRLRGCRRLLHMAGDLQCWSKYPSAAARWRVKTSNRTYVLSFEDYSG